MIFKSSSVALVVSSVLAFSASANTSEIANSKLSVGNQTNSVTNSNSDTKSAFAQSNAELGIYLLRLSQKSALDAAYAIMGTDRSAVVTKIDAQQSTVIAAIKSLDGSAVITNKARLTDNVLYVQMKHDIVKQLAENTNVLSVQLLSDDASYTAADEFKKFPFLTVKDAGDSVTVAIVGNGIDYTHKALGGAGTQAAYEQAWKNRSNAWDGFPTDTVIGGLDFSAFGESSYHEIDYNPIEAVEDINVDSGFIPSGTAIAARVLEQAPNAKILAYKTWDWSKDYYYPVLDVIVDPNQDGDFSDRPDVILLNSYGNGAFYVEDDTSGSQPTLDISLSRRLSATGSLIVVGAGKTEYNSYFNLAWRAAIPEALTVGSVKMTDAGATLSKFTPAGPVRGTQLLKPEVVAPAEDIMGPIAGSGEAMGEFEGHHSYAAAYVAGQAAKLMVEFPQLTGMEIKALIANTAVSASVSGATYLDEETETSITNVAEVPFMGSGLVSTDNATQAKALVWETSNYQPGLAFGFVEVTSSTSITRDLTIKNITTAAQTYTVSSEVFGTKGSNGAVSFIFPETISIPANHAVSFPVTMMINGENLTDWPLMNSDDYSIDNWTEASINGYLVFSNADEVSAQLSMPWQVFPKNNSDVVRSDYHNYWQLPFPADQWQEKAWSARVEASSTWQDITNTSNQTKTIYTMPVMHTVTAKEESKASGQGNLIKNIGAMIVDEQMCSSGSKLSVAVQMFDKFDLPMAEHFDKAGHVLTYFSIYSQEVSDIYANDPMGLQDTRAVTEDDVLGYIEVFMDGDGKPQTMYVDYDMDYEWWNPTGRYKYSKLGAEVSPGDDTVVANVCLEDLYHGPMQSVDVWDSQLGWIFATDRDAQANIDETVIRFNPVYGGNIFQEVIDHTGQNGWPNWWDWNCNLEGNDSFGDPKTADYCIENKLSFYANWTQIAKVPADETEEKSWSNKVVIAPGESATVATLEGHNCTTAGIHLPGRDLSQCPAGIMVFEIGNDNIGFSGIKFGYDLEIKSGQGFSVYENADNGTVVAQVAVSNEAYFYDGAPNAGPIYMVNALPGTPFSVATDGTITVANSAALDYETTQSYTLKLHADYVNRDSVITDVIVNIKNRNDNAPVVINALDSIKTQTGQAVSIATAFAFVDIESDGISFSAIGLPSGLTMDKAGLISGTVNSPGDYSITVNAFDGINQTSTTLNLNVQGDALSPELSSPVTEVEVEDTSTSGGSTAPLLLMLAGFAMFRRRLSK